MADVYTFRVVVELRLATHDTPEAVGRELRTAVGSFLRAELDLDHGTIDEVLAYSLRVKRLDNAYELPTPTEVA